MTIEERAQLKAAIPKNLRHLGTLDQAAIAQALSELHGQVLRDATVLMNDAIVAAKAEARLATLEEAADVADKELAKTNVLANQILGNGFHELAKSVRTHAGLAAKYIALEIRALKDEEKP